MLAAKRRQGEVQAAAQATALSIAAEQQLRLQSSSDEEVDNNNNNNNEFDYQHIADGLLEFCRLMFMGVQFVKHGQQGRGEDKLVWLEVNGEQADVIGSSSAHTRAVSRQDVSLAAAALAVGSNNNNNNNNKTARTAQLIWLTDRRTSITSRRCNANVSTIHLIPERCHIDRCCTSSDGIRRCVCIQTPERHLQLESDTEEIAVWLERGLVHLLQQIAGQSTGQ